MESVELSVISARTFHRHLDKQRFCCTDADVKKGKCTTPERIIPLDSAPASPSGAININININQPANATSTAGAAAGAAAASGET